MSEITERIEKFISYAKTLEGYEKGEAQVFCDRLFIAFGHDGYKEAGATLEHPIKTKSAKGTRFADLLWKPRVIIEMKRSGENLLLHQKQAFYYWIHAVPNRPRYVVLCNFDEFWIYDFDKQIEEPIDIVILDDLAKRYTALNFLFSENPDPVFGNDREAVSREAANCVATLFNSLIARGIPRQQAQRFVLQIVVAMFAEDIDLLPATTVHSIVSDCLDMGQTSYDLFGGLFRQMNNPTPATGGRFQKVRYFNGGLFAIIDPIDLESDELELIGGSYGAATQDWSKVDPAIFGTLFQQSMDAGERHAYGAHFTSEADIMRIINPAIVLPWQERIAKASSLKELISLRKELLTFKVLDPACGSGNFLYVSYRQLVRLEIDILSKVKSQFSEKNFSEQAKALSLISPHQFYGIDRDSFGVELAKVSLMIAKKLAIDEAISALDSEQSELGFEKDEALPLDNLDANFTCGDALFEPWPETSVIVGNPPYQSKNKIQAELGRAYLNGVRDAYPDIDGRADYCVYWFRKAHEHLKDNQRAGLVGTNTIRQNYSREGGLDYILAHGGTITEAVSSMKWQGDAVVFVSVVNWIKGESKGPKRLYHQEGNDPGSGWSYEEREVIGSSLSFALDVTQAKPIRINAARGGCYQGQTHGNAGFLLSKTEAIEFIGNDAANGEVIFPFLIAEELVGQPDSLPQRYVIDFHPLDFLSAQRYTKPFARVKNSVLPDREKAAETERERNDEALSENPKARVNNHHKNFLKRWWQLSYPRGDMKEALNNVRRYIVCGRVTSRPIFEFVHAGIRPNDALMVFPYEDDYSFGILQSGIHWTWFTNRCSTLKGDPRYTSNTVFDSFVWPQSPTISSVKSVAKAAAALREVRLNLKAKHHLSLRDLYRSLELPGAHPLKDMHMALDTAVAEAYGMAKKADPLAFLLELNETVSAASSKGSPVLGPGLPPCVGDTSEFVTEDSIRIVP